MCTVLHCAAVGGSCRRRSCRRHSCRRRQTCATSALQMPYARVLLNCSACLSQAKHHERALRVAQEALDLVLASLGLDLRSPQFRGELEVACRCVEPAEGPGSTASVEAIGVAAAAAYNVACQHEHLSSSDRAGAKAALCWDGIAGVLSPTGHHCVARPVGSPTGSHALQRRCF